MQHLIKLPIAYIGGETETLENKLSRVEMTSCVTELLILRTVGSRSDIPFKVPRVIFDPIVTAEHDVDFIMFGDPDEFEQFYYDEVTEHTTRDFPWTYNGLSFGDIAEKLTSRLTSLIDLANTDEDLALLISYLSSTKGVVVSIDLVHTPF